MRGIAAESGHASFEQSQTDMTKSNGCPANSTAPFDTWLEMSMPIAFIASTASGWTLVGFMPALKHSYRSPAILLSRPSAIWLRAELSEHKNSTRFVTSHPS
jgi:hypothetical protein